MAKNNPAVEKWQQAFEVCLKKLRELKKQFSEKGGAFDDDFPSDPWTVDRVKAATSFADLKNIPEIDALAESIVLRRNAILNAFEDFRSQVREQLDALLTDRHARSARVAVLRRFEQQKEDLLDYPTQWNPTEYDLYKWEEARRRIVMKNARISP